MKYYKVPVYEATVCNTKPFVDIKNLGEAVVAKPKGFSKVTEPNTGVPISIQKSRYGVRGLVKVNQDQISENGFCLFVYQSHLTDEKQVSEDYYEKWLANLNYSKVYQCCQEMVEPDSKPAYQRVIGKKRR